MFSHLCPRGQQFPFGELRRWLPGHEVPARAECVDEDGLLLEAEVFLRVDHKLKFCLIPEATLNTFKNLAFCRIYRGDVSISRLGKTDVCSIGPIS